MTAISRNAASAHTACGRPNQPETRVSVATPHTDLRQALSAFGAELTSLVKKHEHQIGQARFDRRNQDALARGEKAETEIVRTRGIRSRVMHRLTLDRLGTKSYLGLSTGPRAIATAGTGIMFQLSPELPDGRRTLTYQQLTHVYSWPDFFESSPTSPSEWV
ncbi:MAG: hypothetical protein H6729_06445 [Deltaproteobacteria bacterium]|nr:hypothetical protein [Deltaproteobacteria bacterium]